MSIGAQNLKSREAASAISYPEYRDLLPARSLDGCGCVFPDATRSPLAGRWGIPPSLGHHCVGELLRRRAPGIALGRGFDPSRDDAPAPLV
jgi:hypothetical protein